MVIFLIIAIVIIIIMLILWQSGRAAWKKQKKEMDTRYSELLSQKEQTELLLKSIRHAQETGKEQEQNVLKELQLRVLESEERDGLCTDREKEVRAAAVKIHLYIQLIREQCESPSAQKQCDVISAECEKFLLDKAAVEKERQ